MLKNDGFINIKFWIYNHPLTKDLTLYETIAFSKIVNLCDGKNRDYVEQNEMMAEILKTDVRMVNIVMESLEKDRQVIIQTGNWGKNKRWNINYDIFKKYNEYIKESKDVSREEGGLFINE